MVAGYNKKMRITKLFIGLAVVALLVVGGIKVYDANQQHKAEVAAQAAAAKKAAEEKAAIAKMNSLKQKLTTLIGSSTVSTSVSVIDLGSGKSTQAGLDVVFRAASTTKVLSVAAYMHEVEQGNATLQTLVSSTKAQTLIERMLRNSDNNAWAAIDKYIGEDELAAYAESIGVTSYGSAQNTITSNDMALLFQKLYQNQLMSKANTQLILSFMQKTNNDDLIPGGSPEAANVYHKFGLYEGELHDAAVVSYKGHTFVLVIFTNNENGTIANYAARTAYIHELTAATLQALTTSASASSSS